MNYSLSSVTDLKELYFEALKHSDPRVRHYFLAWNDPTAVIVLLILYLLVITVGKKYMESRPAFNIPASFLFIYNFGLVLLSIYMFKEILFGAIESNYNFFCAKLNVSNAESEMRVTNALWWYFFSKAIELLDTVWMILRKRFVQVTFLHCFHHFSMLTIWWVVFTWIPGGQSYFGAGLNCLVHVFMYAYYAFSVIPSLKDKLWWKSYITKIQLIQFVITLSHTLNGLFRSCEFPMWGQYLLASYMIIMLVLFANFYIHEYIKKSNERKRKSEKKKVDLNNNTVSNGHKSHHANGHAKNGISRKTD